MKNSEQKAEETLVSPNIGNIMLAAAASLSDDEFPVENKKSANNKKVFKYNIEIHSSKDLGINMAGVDKLIIIK
jgi:hypothetical protein